MKRKLLIPALTSLALAPTIAMVGCGDSQAKLVLDKYLLTDSHQSLISREKTLIKKDSIIKFKIDIDKWGGSKSAETFDHGRLFLNYIKAETEIKVDFACHFDEDFEFVVDGSPLDKSYFIPVVVDSKWINIKPEGFEKILNASVVEGYVHIPSLRCSSLDPCWFELRGILNQ